MNTKTIFKALALAMMMPAMLLTTACSSDDDAVNDNANNQKKYYEIPVTVTVSRQGDEGTRAVYDNMTLSFSTGDKLFVSGSHQDAGNFAGALEWQSGGTFSGILFSSDPYSGTIENFLADSKILSVNATLLPAGYTDYNYLKLAENGVSPIVSESGINYLTQVSANLSNSLVPLGKDEAVAQLSYEWASGYNDNGNGYVFELRPRNPVICCTIRDLPANTSVSVVYDGTNTDISGNITTDGDGTATFAFADFNEAVLGTLTVKGSPISLPSNIQLAYGKVYKINKSAKITVKDLVIKTDYDFWYEIVEDNPGKIYIDGKNIKRCSDGAKLWQNVHDGHGWVEVDSEGNYYPATDYMFAVDRPGDSEL